MTKYELSVFRIPTYLYCQRNQDPKITGKLKEQKQKNKNKLAMMKNKTEY
jgi:hypothetical protein